MSGFTEFALTAGRSPLACCLGPDGNVWYISNGGASRVCKITPAGTVTEYACPDSAADLQDICAGPDGNLWALGYTSNKVYKVTTAGSFTSYSSGITAAAGLYTICAGPDGNLWFTELGGKVGKITTGGTVTEYSAGITTGSQPLAIASDGTSLWFTEYHTTNGNRVCKITTSGTVTEYAISTGSFKPSSIVKAPDGNMWVGSFNTDKVLKVTSGGTITEYTVSTGTAKPAMLTVVGDHLYALLYGTQKIVPITTAGASGTAQTIPTGSAGTQSRICTGQDGASVWFCEYSTDKIGVWSELAPAADTWGWSDAPLLSTSVQRFSGGRFYANDGASNVYIDSTKRITEHGTASAVSTSFPGIGVTNLADTGAGFLGYTLNGPGASNNGQTDLTVDNDVAICADVGAFSSNCAAAANLLLYQDANNWYRLEVAKTAGGTSTLYKKVAGVETAVATVAKGVALNAYARAQIYRNASSALGLIVDGVAGTYSDPSPLSGPFTVYLGAPAVTGTSDNRIRNIEVTYGTKVRILGCPTGGGAAIYDAAGTLIASASESAGIATLDLAGQQFPFTGYVQVLSSVSPAKNVPDGRFPYSGTTSFYGGDDLYYKLASSTGISNVKVLTTSAEATYPTTQTGSHNGVVVHGTKTIAAWLGFGGKVYASSYDDATGEYVENQIGTHADMHSTCDLQADSSGILHFVWGGSTIGEQTTKYRKSNTAWSITDLATETDLGEKIRGSLLIDASDNLYLVGSRSNSASYDQAVSKKRTGGSWQSTVVLANADASWALYPCDATLGRDGKLHAMWMAWSSGTGFEHAFHAKSADGSTWTGITGTSLTLPLSQNSGTGKLSNSATLAADGDYGVSRLTVDSDGTVHAVIGRNASTYAYFKGSASTGWPASPTYSFTGTVYSNHGAIERFGNYLVYITCTPGSNALYRWLSQDGGTTWTQTTALALPGGTRDIWWWPKLTPVAGSAYAKSVWTGRGTVYANKDGSSPLSGAGQGALYIADVSVVLDVAAGDTWAWSDTASRSALTLSRAPADTWTWSDAAVRSGSGPSSRTAGDTWSWTDTPARSRSSARGSADSWAWTDSAGGSVATHSYSRTAGDTWAWSDAAVRDRVVKLPASATFVSASSQTANFTSARSQTADFVNNASSADFVAGPT